MFSARIDYSSSLPISCTPRGQMQCICHIQDHAVRMARQLHHDGVVQSICVTCAGLGPSWFGGFRPPTTLSFGACRAAIANQMGGPKDHHKHHLSSASSGQCISYPYYMTTLSNTQYTTHVYTCPAKQCSELPVLMRI